MNGKKKKKKKKKFDAYVESERMKRYYEKEEDRLEKFEKALYKRYDYIK